MFSQLELLAQWLFVPFLFPVLGGLVIGYGVVNNLACQRPLWGNLWLHFVAGLLLAFAAPAFVYILQSHAGVMNNDAGQVGMLASVLWATVGSVATLRLIVYRAFHLG